MMRGPLQLTLKFELSLSELSLDAEYLLLSY